MLEAASRVLADPDAPRTRQEAVEQVMAATQCLRPAAARSKRRWRRAGGAAGEPEAEALGAPAQAEDAATRRTERRCGGRSGWRGGPGARGGAPGTSQGQAPRARRLFSPRREQRVPPPKGDARGRHTSGSVPPALDQPFNKSASAPLRQVVVVERLDALAARP